MREYLADNDLDLYSAVILHESHKRTIQTDIHFGLLKEVCQQRPEVNIIDTNAALDTKKFLNYFLECPIFTNQRRNFPVKIFHNNKPESTYLEAAIIKVMQISLSKPTGDIWDYLTGQAEIDSCCETIFTCMRGLGQLAPQLIVLPVYSSLLSKMQLQIFESAL